MRRTKTISLLARISLAAGIVLCARAQTSEASAVRRAEAEVQRIQGLVNSGVLPRKALTQAQDVVDEARDHEILASVLYGQVKVEDLTEQQGDEMLAAAQRYWDRQKRKVEERQKLVDAGVLAKTAMADDLDELNRRRQTYDLAVERAHVLQELASIVHSEAEMQQQLEAEAEAPGSGEKPIIERYDGNGVFSPEDLRETVLAYQDEFDKPLPISANGETATHRAMGFDHRGRVDVALMPDSDEGLWLRHYLETKHIPYYAIRGYVPGKATAAHVHIGPPSLRLRRAD